MKITLEVDTTDRQSVLQAIHCLENILLDKPVFNSQPNRNAAGREWRVKKWLHKISALRLIREFTDYGLKEALDLANGAEQGWVTFSAPTQFFEAIRLISEGLQTRDPENHGDTDDGYDPPQTVWPSDPFLA